jgi:hypothetical protein
MSLISTIFSTRNLAPSDSACVREIHADILSVGGAVMLAACGALTLVAVGIVPLTAITSAQRAIILLLTAGSWLYVVESLSERLRILDHHLEYKTLMSSRRIPLEQLQSMSLTYQGLNMERGIESIEIRRRGKPVERIALGPCWQRHKLEAFIRSVQDILSES